jgi:hypothetical protein
MSYLAILGARLLLQISKQGHMPTYEMNPLKSQRNKYLYSATADKPGKVWNNLSVTTEEMCRGRKEERERERAKIDRFLLDR